MKMKTIKCDYCGDSFEKPLAEWKRSQKKKMKSFCDGSCSTSYRNSHRPKGYWSVTYNNLKGLAGNRLDEFSPFKPYLLKGRASNIAHKMSLTPQQLKDLWEKQGGVCPYTGIKMILPRTTKENQSTRSLKKASLDRIDSSKGYEIGNVEFVCYAINNAKNNFAKKEMTSFIQEIISSVNCGGAARS